MVDEFPTNESAAVGRARSNIAYFAAVMYGVTGDDSFRNLASTNVDLARKLFGTQLSSKDKDTFGYVLIEIGQTVEEVEEGLALCRSAHAEIASSSNFSEKLKAVSQRFFELHREIAYARLSMLCSREGET